MANGLDIVRRVLERLRKPADTALPYKTVLRAVGEKIAQKRLDLTLSEHNHLMSVSEWFTPNSNDVELGRMDSKLSGVLLPVRAEVLPVGSALETGRELDIVSYQALADSPGAVAFYGSPLRMVFHSSLENLQYQKVRVAFEEDFFFPSDSAAQLSRTIELPEYFSGMIALEAAYDLLDAVEDDSAEWNGFVARVSEKWLMMISDERKRWDKYVRTVKGKVRVPKRNYFDNRSRRNIAGRQIFKD